MNNLKGVDDPTLKGVGNLLLPKEQIQFKDPATLAVPDPLKRKVSDPLEPEQPTEAVKESFGSTSADVEEYVYILEEEGEPRGLVEPREMPRLWSRHAVNAAAVLDFLLRKGQVLDTSSGVSLSGIVIATCRPDLDVHLAEPIQRRCEWLFDVVENFGSDNATIHQTRAEELRGKGQADVIIARTAANASKLIRMMTRLIAPGGSLTAFKGRCVAIEIEEAAKELKSHHPRAEIHEAPSTMEDESTHMVVCRRQKQAGLGVRTKSKVKPGLTTGSELNAEPPRSDLRRVAGRGRRCMPV